MKQEIGEYMHRLNVMTCLLLYRSGVLDAVCFQYAINAARTDMIDTIHEAWMPLPVRTERRCEHAAGCPIWKKIDRIQQIFEKLSLLN
jgi:hypothetical protein